MEKHTGAFDCMPGIPGLPIKSEASPEDFPIGPGAQARLNFAARPHVIAKFNYGQAGPYTTFKVILCEKQIPLSILRITKRMGVYREILFRQQDFSTITKRPLRSARSSEAQAMGYYLPACRRIIHEKRAVPISYFGRPVIMKITVERL